jgi:hypothetical protein
MTNIVARAVREREDFVLRVGIQKVHWPMICHKHVSTAGTLLPVGAWQFWCRCERPLPRAHVQTTRTVQDCAQYFKPTVMVYLTI